jgi:PAS domain S-box-containing protein
MNAKAVILIVDDTLENLQVLVALLSAAGYQALPANSGELALAAVAARRPDLILLDIRMPGMDGFEVCRRLKAQAEIRDIPVMFISAAGENAERVEGFRLGAVDFIAKPIQSEELLARVQTHLQLHRLQVEAEQQASDLRLANERLQEELAERQQAESSLQESESQYRTLANSGQALIWTSGIDKKCHYFNQPWLAFTGRTLEQEMGDGWTEGVHPDDLARCVEIYAGAFDRRECFSMDYRIRHHDGAWRWIQDDGSPRYDVHGNFLGYIGHCLDITLRKQAEGRIRNSEATLNAITASAHDAIVMMNNDGTIAFWNPAAAELFGYAAAEVLGRNLHALLVPASYGDAHARAFPRWQKTGTGNAIGKTIEMSALRKNGQNVPVELSLSSVEIDGRWMAVGMLRDITERKRAEAELQQYREHLEERVLQRTVELATSRDQAQAANRAKSVFLANMSHELRTPLTAIIGFAEVISQDPAIPGRTKENLAIILRSGEHLLALINDILDLSQIDAGRTEIDRHDVDPGQLVRDVLDMMRGRADAKGLRLVLDQTADLPRLVSTDPGKLRQILINLVGNAIKFTHAGQVLVRLATAETAPAGHGLTIEVEDTGIGISRNDLERIFQPFEQVGDHVIAGTGLGLAITREHVQMLGGQISVESELGKGSCFRVAIPVGRSAGDVPAPSSRHPVGIASPTADLRILIVEDQKENSLLIRSFLEPHGFQIREAVDGKEAIAIFQKWRPLLIFMDRRMPVLDGLEATRRIRALPGGGKAVIIAVSAHSFKTEQQEMLDAGCNDFIGKPFTGECLLSLLQRHLHLELVCADDNAPPSATRPLSAADLRPLSPDVLATLHRLAIEGDDAELANWLEAQDSLSPATRETLAGLIKNYRFETIQEISMPPER